MSDSESSVRPLSQAAGDEEGETGLYEIVTKKDSSHKHRGRRPNETTTITITPPASPPPELADAPGSGRVKKFQGYVAVFVLVGVIVSCLIGIFTNYGHERCDCNDLRNYFCGMLGFALAALTSTAKDKFTK
jgi:hypothetical protein